MGRTFAFNPNSTDSTQAMPVNGKVHIQTIQPPESAELKKEMTEWAVVKALCLYGHLPMATTKDRDVMTTVAGYIESGTAPQMIKDGHARAAVFALIAEDKGVMNESVMKRNIEQFLKYEESIGLSTLKKLLAFEIDFIPDTVCKHHPEDPLPAYERYALSVMDYFHYMLQVSAEQYYTSGGGAYPPDMQALQDEFAQSIKSNCIFNYTHLYELYNHIKD